MREPPPPHLTALLTRLGLATEADLESVEPAVQRMAGELPRFESIWIDALRQARVLTQFQASEIHAGRGESLRVARYVLCHSVHECGYATIYKAEEQETQGFVRLALFSPGNRDRETLLPQLERLIALERSLPSLTGMVTAGGLDGQRVWAASPWVEGTPLADFLLHHGRFPPEAVLEIARAMLGQLATLEAANLVHGDIRVQNVLISSDGDICIPHAGLRSIMRPQEGISFHDLAPDACSGLAPERVTEGAPPSVASDLFACGCAWWHMLCGRPPLGCGDVLARLRAAQAAAIDDLHRWAADIPDVLVEAIGDCLQKDPRKRPPSMADLARRLGPLRRHGRQTIARCLLATARPRAPWLRTKRAKAKRAAHPHRLTAAAIAAVAAVAVAWPIWVAQNKPPVHAQVAARATSTDGKPQAGQIAPAVEKGPRERPPRPLLDRAVTPAGYAAAIGQPRSDENIAIGESSVGRIGNPSYDPRTASSPENELHLSSDRPVRGELLQLKPGQRVCGQRGRVRIVVPREGLSVQADRVSFENIDFTVDEQSSPPAFGTEASATLVRLLAAQCNFVGCSFQSASGNPEPCTALKWQYASERRAAAVALPTGRICLKNCVFRRVGTGIESHVQGAIGLEMVHVLHLGPGPLIRLGHAPAADEPVRISLSQVTLREADALLECRCGGQGDRAGEINIEATGCVLAPRAGNALVVFSSQAFPTSLLHELKWTGQGSVVAGPVVFGQWRRGDGTRQTLDDATISIAGLVRGEVEFAGAFDGDPARSQVINCQAPLRDSETAGAATRDLPREVVPANH
jgi:serine/threonine-protein kinase